MAQDDLIAALQQAVRQEIAETYFHERRVLEEERAMLLEETSAYHGQEAACDGLKAQLAQALLTPEAAERAFAMAAMALPEGWAARRLGPPLPGRALGGLTTCGRHWRLVRALYEETWRAAERLREEHGRLLALLDEVNADIKHFEANHDLLALMSYMRSMDPQELQRRKIMGVNFGHGETAAAAAQLSFRPLSVAFLHLEQPPERPRPPAEVRAGLRKEQRQACRRERAAAQALLAQRRRWLDSLGR